MKSFSIYFIEKTTQQVENWQELLDKNDMLRAGTELCGEIEMLEPNAEALIVGGVVRDLLLGKEIHDVDIATNVDTEKISQHFKSVDIGKSKTFGIVSVQYKGFNFEVAHYREEQGSADSRHPDVVKGVSSFELDSARRDFTINSLGITKEGMIIDYQNGLEDLKNKIIRAVGRPQDRFIEDALRILRAARFSSKFGFSIEPETKHAMSELNHMVDSLSKERVQEELIKAANSGSNLANYITQLDESGILERVLPEITKLKGMEQSVIHHPEGDAFQHTIAALKTSPSSNPVTNLAILFHDIGKGESYVFQNDKHTYHDHDRAGEKIIDSVGKRLKFSNSLIETLKFAARHHMNVHDIHKMKKSKVANIVNNPNWEILKDVCYADEMCRPRKGNEESFRERITNAEQLAKELSAGSGQLGLEMRLKQLIDGNKLLAWLPELKQRENQRYISTIKREVQDWIINNNLFTSTDEQIKQFAINIFDELKRQNSKDVHKPISGEM